MYKLIIPVGPDKCRDAHFIVGLGIAGVGKLLLPCSEKQKLGNSCSRTGKRE